MQNLMKTNEYKVSGNKQSKSMDEGANELITEVGSEKQVNITDEQASLPPGLLPSGASLKGAHTDTHQHRSVCMITRHLDSGHPLQGRTHILVALRPTVCFIASDLIGPPSPPSFQVLGWNSAPMHARQALYH